jgi:replicative DNA helicase
MNIYYEGLSAIAEGKLSPEEIGDASATEITRVTAGSVRRTELRDWMDKGREGARQLKRLQLSRQQGIEIGAYTGLSFIDKHTRGIAPGELAFIASEPGAGKTALA